MLGARIRDPRAFASRRPCPIRSRAGGGALRDAALELARAEQTAAQRDAQAELAAQRRPMPTKPNACASMPGAGGGNDMRLSLAVAGTARSGRVAPAAPRRSCASVMPSGMPRRPSWPNPARRQPLQAQAEARDAHAQAQLRSNPAAAQRARWLNELDAERMSAAGSTNWTRNAAPPSACSPSWTRPSRRANARRRAGGRAATRRGTPADRGTRGPGPVCRTGGAADKAGGGNRGALGGGTGGREREGAGREPEQQRGADSDGRAAGPDPGAGWATGRADPASDDADHAAPPLRKWRPGRGATERRASRELLSDLSDFYGQACRGR